MAESAEDLNRRGLREVGNGDFAAAALSFRSATEVDPKFAQAHNHLGATLVHLGRLEESLTAFEQAIGLEPDRPESHQNLGYALEKLGRGEDAVAALRRAVELKEDYPDAWNNLGNALAVLDRVEEAAAAYRKAIQLAPKHPAAYNGLGTELARLGRGDHALECFGRAIQIDPQYVEAYNNAGLLLRQLRRPAEAVQCFKQAAAIAPEFADAYANLGVTFADLRQTDDAIGAFTRALELDPANSTVRGQRLFQLARNCDWDLIAVERSWLPKLGVEGGVLPPFSMLALDDDPMRNRIRSERFAAAALKSVARHFAAPASRPSRLRIGYFSSDFYDHASMYLAAGLFEAHDRERFLINAYSYGPPINDAMRARAQGAFDSFFDIDGLDAGTAASKAREDGIDIAVDLKGYTEGNRTAIFAERAAPIQISFLGYPGTSGAPFIDYLVADSTVIPTAWREAYSEKLITLPHSYQVNDRSRPIADGWTRARAALPEGAFVFCCFNNSYKITSAEFDIWTRILEQTPNSILWLLVSSETARANLRLQAERRGIDPGRIHFADHLPLADHLGRLQLADLFLDTFNYNGHTTASDALWAGVPIVTKAGNGFSARVAASVLKAMGRDELIVESDGDYGALAIRLAESPGELAAVRSKLANDRAISPLFDSQRFARALEAGFDQAFASYIEGREPEDITIG